MFFLSVALFQKMILLAIFPPKGCFDFLLDDCPLKTKLTNLPAASPPKRTILLFCWTPVRARFKNLPAACPPKEPF
jgi:hypothetical protein